MIFLRPESSLGSFCYLRQEKIGRRNKVLLLKMAYLNTSVEISRVM